MNAIPLFQQHSGCSTPRAGRRTTGGFTIIELMVTVAIVAILVGVAGPSFSDLIAGQRIKGAAADLHSALLKARSEAIKRNARVTLAPTTANNWQTGWSTTTLDDGVTLQLDDHAAISGITITTTASNVIYLSSGRISGSDLPLFDVWSPNTSKHVCVTVDLSGRPYSKTQTSSC